MQPKLCHILCHICGTCGTKFRLCHTLWHIFFMLISSNAFPCDLSECGAIQYLKYDTVSKGSYTPGAARFCVSNSFRFSNLFQSLFTQKLNKFPQHIQSYLSSFFFNHILIWGGSQSVLGMGYSSVKFHITFSAKLCRAFWTLDFILNMPKSNMSVELIFASCGKFTLFAFKDAFNHIYFPSSSSHIDKCIRLHALKVGDKLTNF